MPNYEVWGGSRSGRQFHQYDEFSTTDDESARRIVKSKFGKKAESLELRRVNARADWYEVFDGDERVARVHAYDWGDVKAAMVRKFGAETAARFRIARQER